MAQSSGEATAPVPEERPSYNPELGLQFARAVLLFPRVVPGERDSVTYARAPLARSLRPKSLEFRTPAKNAADALQKIGLRNLGELQARKAPATPQGAFASLESLGITLAFFGHDRDYARLRECA